MNSPSPSQISALEAFQYADWPRAWQLANRRLAAAPGNAALHYIAGVAALQLSDLRMATRHLRQACSLAPGTPEYSTQLARAMVMSGRSREAIVVADEAASHHPSSAVIWDTLGVVYSKAGMHDKAAAAFGRAVGLSPDCANHRFNLGTSCLYDGDLDEAEIQYRTCLSLDPKYWRAYLALAHLRKQTVERNHTTWLEALIYQYPDEPDAALHLHLALAKEYEDLGRTAEAFAHYARGKAAGRRNTRSSTADDDALFDAIERFFSAPLVRLPTGDDTREPIFVVGMPRSGTTLVDRILSSHPAVTSAGELGNFARLLQRAGCRPSRTLPDIFRNLDPAFDEWSALGRAYLESTRPATGHTQHFIDKQPHNFLYAGFIVQALPQAKIICVRRNPMDTCLSNFRQLFAPDSPLHAYSFDLLDTGRYFARFDRLMRRWEALFPGRILQVDYEALVEKQEAVTRGLLDFCGLEWNAACLSFEDNAAPVATASAPQVRSSMNRDSIHRWQRYAKQLAPLRKLLEAEGIRVE